MKHALRARRLVKRFARPDGTNRVVLDGFDLDVASGELTVCTAKAGRGRTTLLRCVAGAYRLDAGEVAVTVDGETVDLASAGPRALAFIRSRYTAVLDAPLPAPPRMAAVDVIARAACVEGSDARAALDRLGLGALGGVAFGLLRPGESRAVALAAALANRAPFLLLDDPLTGVDGARPTDVVAWIDERREAGAAVVATCDPGAALVAYASRQRTLGEGDHS